VTLVDWVLATLAVSLGATLQGSVGFGLGILGAPLLMLIDPRLVPAPLLCAALTLTILLTHRERRSVVLRDLKWALAGRLVGTVAGAAALTALSGGKLELTLGVLVLLGVAMSASGLHLPVTPRVLMGAGALSGFMGTTVSIGAPPMALVYQRSSGPRIRGTLSAYFVVGVILSLVGLSVVGRFGTAELVLAVSLLPGILIGFVASRHTSGFFDRGYTRAAVLVLSAATGLVVILRQLV